MSKLRLVAAAVCVALPLLNTLGRALVRNQPTRSAFVFAGIVLLAIGGISQATPIIVNNASFEAELVSNGGFLATVSAWVIGPSISIPGGPPVGTSNPSASEYPGGLAPDGQNIAFSKDGTISQVLAATLTANTTYSLQVDVGHRADNPVFLGYSVELLAGGVTLASESSLSPAPGTFLTSTVSFATGASHVLLGQPLQILLDVIPQQGGPGYQVQFDNVRLAAVTAAVPTVGTLSLFVFGLTSLAAIRRRLQPRG